MKQGHAEAAEAPGMLRTGFAARRVDAAGPLIAGAPMSPTRKRVRTGLRVTIHADLAEVEKAWRAFEAHADCTPFQTFGWLSAWQAHFGRRRRVQPAILSARDDAGLVFILPLAVERSAFVRRLTFLGGALSDYNAPLLAGDFASRLRNESFPELWQKILALLQADPRFRFDLADLTKMPERVGAQKNPFLALRVRSNPSRAYVATLDGDWETFYAAKRSASTRKREKRQFRQLGAHGDIRFVEARMPEETNRTLAALYAQKGEAFGRMGVANVFRRAEYREFYRAVAADPRMARFAHVSRLDVGADIAATSVGLKFRDTYALVLSSYADGDIARHGPGRAHLHMLMQHAMAEGFQKFDFTIGDEPYKRDWSDVELRLYDHLSGATLRGAALAAAIAAAHSAKRRIKRSPRLWRAFTRIRAFKGALRARR